MSDNGLLRSIARVLAYAWALPNTALGLTLLPWTHLSGGRSRVVGGVIEIQSGLVRWLLTNATLLPGGASALTLGHVVLGRDEASLERTREHERVHVRQYERWGPFFLPAYLLWSLMLWTAGKDPYYENPFEREAFGVA